MNLRLKPLSLLTFPLLSIFISNGQTIQSDYEKLNLSDKGYKIENTIYLDISGSDYENIKAVTGRKINVKAKLLIINGDMLISNEGRINPPTILRFNYKRK